MKKTIALTLLLGGGLVLSGCQTNLFGPNGDNPSELIVERKTMAFQATTGITLMRDLNFNGPSVSMALRGENSGSENTDPITTSDIPVATLDLLFTNGHDFKVEQIVSDREEYEFLDVVSFNIFDDEQISYSLYYNGALVEDDEDDIDDEDATTEEIEPVLRNGNVNKQGEEGQKGNGNKGNGNKGKDGNKNGTGNEDNSGNKGEGDRNRDRDRDRIDSEYLLTGIAIVGDEEYEFISKTEIDTDSDEQEIEMMFKIYKDKQNFISIKQEIEIEGVFGEEGYEYEEEFKYVVVEDGKVVKSFKLELEDEDGEQELMVKIDQVKYEVEYEYIDDKTFIHITVRGHNEFIYEKVVTVDDLTEERSVAYILQ